MNSSSPSKPLITEGMAALNKITGPELYEIRFHATRPGHERDWDNAEPRKISQVLGTLPSIDPEGMRKWIAGAFRLNILPSPIAYTDELRISRVENDAEGKLIRRKVVAVWRPAWVECEGEADLNPIGAIEVVQ